MKINCDYFKDRREARDEAYVARITEWHDWYAWFPIRLGNNDCRWFETIKRRGRFSYRFTGWEYMPLQSSMEQAGKS